MNEWLLLLLLLLHHYNLTSRSLWYSVLVLLYNLLACNLVAWAWRTH
jgi:hypothetical protein